jgi:uridylate kinase
MKKSPYKRVLLKVSGEALLGDREYGISHEATVSLAKEIKEVSKLGVEIALVLGAGNIFRGLSASRKGFDRVTADYIGMLAIVMNGLAFQAALDEIGVESRVMSALEIKKVCEPFIRRRAMKHMRKGRIVILVAGTGLPFVTSDSGAAIKALELKANILMKGTKVDGVYDKDPVKFSDAKKFEELSYREAIVSDDIRVMDKSAVSMCEDNKMPILVFNLFKEGNLEKALSGEKIGTLVH